MSKRPLHIPSSTRFKSKLVSVSAGTFICKADGYSYRAEKAFSCLVMPQVGDTVLLFRDEETTYITEILKREKLQHVEIAVSSISISSEEEMRFEAGSAINTFAPEANVVISEVSVLSRVLHLRSELFNSVVNTVQAFVTHLHMKNSSVTQQVEEHVEMQCGSSRKVVKGSDIYNIKDQITIAEGQVKIDAQQINMG